MRVVVVVFSVAAVNVVLAAQEDPKLFKQLAKSAKEIDFAEDSEKQEHAWCKDTAAFLQKTIAFTADLKETVENDSLVLEQDRKDEKFERSFITFLDGVLQSDAAVVGSLQKVTSNMKDVGGRLCHGYQTNAIQHRAAALEKSVVLSHKLDVFSKNQEKKTVVPMARALLEVKNKKHKNTSPLCEHMELAERTLAREQSDVDIASRTSDRIALVAQSQRKRSDTSKDFSESVSQLSDRLEEIRTVDKQRFGSEDPVVSEAAVVLTQVGDALATASKSLSDANSYQMRNILRQAQQVKEHMGEAVEFLSTMKSMCSQKEPKMADIPKVSYKQEVLVKKNPFHETSAQQQPVIYSASHYADINAVTSVHKVVKKQEAKKNKKASDEDLLAEAAASLGLRA